MQIRNIARTFIFGVKYLTPPTLNVDAALTLKGANHHLLISVQIGGQGHSSLGDAPLLRWSCEVFHQKYHYLGTM